MIHGKAAGGTFAVLGMGLKWLAFNGTLLIPGWGILIRTVIAAIITIETLAGQGIIGHFERKHPHKEFTKKTT